MYKSVKIGLNYGPYGRTQIEPFCDSSLSLYRGKLIQKMSFNVYVQKFTGIYYRKFIEKTLRKTKYQTPMH